MKLLACFLILLSSLWAAPTIQTVCASGCTETSLQAAINTAAAANDGPQIIEVTAGENFDTGTGFALPARSGVVTLTGDADPTASRTLVGSKTLFTAELSIGEEITVNGETRTVFSIESDTSLTVNSAFSDTAGGASITKIYNGWIVIRSSRISELPGKTRVAPSDSAKMPTLRVTVGGYVPVLYTSGHPSSYWRLEGLEFTLSTTSLSNIGWLIGLGSGVDTAETEPSKVSHHFVIDRCYIHGIAFDNGPRDGIRVNADNVEILNSYISEIKMDGASSETHGILGYSLNGPLLVRNTFVGGATIGSLIGGANSANVSIQPHNAQFLGNHYQGTPTHRALRYADPPQGTSVPANGVESQVFWDTDDSTLYVVPIYSTTFVAVATGITGNVCVDGDFWEDTTGPTYYACTGGVWVSGASNRTITGGTVSPFVYFAAKNRFELKKVTGALVEGNLIENCFSPTVGQQSCAAFLLNWVTDQDQPWSTLRHITIQNNLIRRTGQMYLEGAIDSPRRGDFLQRWPRHNTVQNNLVQDGNNPGILHAINKLTYYYNDGRVNTGLGGVGINGFDGTTFTHNTVINPLANTVMSPQAFVYGEAGTATGRVVSNNLYEIGGLSSAAYWLSNPGCSGFTANWPNHSLKNNVMVQLAQNVDTPLAGYYDYDDCRTWAFPWKRSTTGVWYPPTAGSIAAGVLTITFGTEYWHGHGLLQGTKVKLAGWSPAGLDGTYTVPRLWCGSGSTITAQTSNQGHTLCLPTVETGTVTPGTVEASVDYEDWSAQNFRLASTSVYKGWATDGSDPGVNQDMVEWATSTASTGVDNPYLDFRVRSITPTADGAVFRFTAYSDAACTWRVDGTRAFTSADSSPVQTRVGRDGVATITGLTSDTGYWYRVTCDGTTRDGQFPTTH